MGIVMNERDRLLEDGYDIGAEQVFAYQHQERLEALEARAKQDPAARAELAAEQARFDPILFERYERLVKLIGRYHPNSGVFKQCQIYLMRWRECVGEPLRELPPGYDDDDDSDEEEDIDALWTTPVYGIPWQKLVDARQTIWDLKLEESVLNRHLAAWTLFLCGLTYGITYAKATGQAAVHQFDDGLHEAAREAWEFGVDFALDEATEKFLTEHASGFQNQAASQLFMGVNRASAANCPNVVAWIFQWNEHDAKLRLLVAMGVRAATDDYGRTLLGKLNGMEELFEALQLRPGLAEIIRGFYYEAEGED